MPSHAEALAQIRAAYQAVMGRPASDCEAAVLAAVSYHETKYGSAWGGAGAGSFNMGAITAGSGWNGPTFSHKDSRPEGGKDVEYVTEFRKYSTADEGFRDLVRAVFIWNGRSSVQREAVRCDLYGVSRELYRTGYYKGLAKLSENERVIAYERALKRAVDLANQKLFDHQTTPLPWLILGLAGAIFWATTRASPLPGRALPKFLRRVA